jgi:nucleotide-binding universal stress UspA family protein
MDYKSIVVCLDNSARSAQRLEFAVELALQHRAHLSGLYATYRPAYPYTPEAAFGALVAQFEEEEISQRRLSENQFRAAVQRAGIPYDWQALHGHVVELVAARARTADLVIAGQYDNDDEDAFVAEGYPELIVLEAGRPTLFLPYAGKLSPVFKRVLVAWNGSREGARALADSLPLLSTAQAVTVMTVESKTEERGPVLVPGADVASYLSRHGVKAEISRIVGVDIAPGEWLLSQAADIGADLIVAGCYGHSRVREFVFGGVTRTLLREMTVPVLMSH